MAINRHLKKHRRPIRGIFGLYFNAEDHFITTQVLVSVKSLLRITDVLLLRVYSCKATDAPPAVHIHNIGISHQLKIVTLAGASLTKQQFIGV